MIIKSDEMQAVEDSFYKLAIKERDYERFVNDSLHEKIKNLEKQIEKLTKLKNFVYAFESDETGSRIVLLNESGAKNILLSWSVEEDINELEAYDELLITLKRDKF